MKPKVLRLLVPLLVVTLLLGGPVLSCAPSPKAGPAVQEPYKVGGLFDLTGYMAGMGVTGRDTIQLYVEEVNKKGGIKGRPLELVIYDSGSDETKGTLALKKMVEVDKVVAVVGEAATGVALALNPPIQEAEIPFLFTTGLSLPIVPVKKWSFKPIPSENEYGTGLLKLAKDMGATKIALLHQAAAYGITLKGVMEKMASEMGLTIVAVESYAPTDTVMRP